MFAKVGASVADIWKDVLLHPSNIWCNSSNTILPHCGTSNKSDLLPPLLNLKYVKAPESPIAPIETVGLVTSVLLPSLYVCEIVPLVSAPMNAPLPPGELKPLLYRAPGQKDSAPQSPQNPYSSA